MLALEGNTAPYLQNAYVRIRSIFRRATEEGVDEDVSRPIAVEEEAERALALKLLQLPQVVRAVGESLEPHRLCNYLYELASAYHRFYERCPVLSAPDERLRGSRLRLSDLTARTLGTGLGLLGIDTIDQM
jgi:arginyl-tRNA synthetase